ncbi:MAG: hypothetical protein R2867_18870 [Caldilineaceae bacterium]
MALVAVTTAHTVDFDRRAKDHSWQLWANTHFQWPNRGHARSAGQCRLCLVGAIARSTQLVDTKSPLPPEGPYIAKNNTDYPRNAYNREVGYTL